MENGEHDKWEVYKDKRGEYRWRRIARNGRIVGRATEGYKARKSAVDNAQRHGMDGNPGKLGASDSWMIYQDKRGEWRWRRTAPNDEITGASSESYKDKGDCEANAKRNGM